MSVDLDAVDARLNVIAQQIIDTTQGATIPQMVVLRLTNRAMELRHLAMQLAESSPVGSAVILRALIDLAILIRWIELRPRLYARLWAAEGARLHLETLENAREAADKRKRPRPPDPDDLADAERIVCRSRALAVGRGVVGRKSESLLPPIWTRVKAIDVDVHQHVDAPGDEDKKAYEELYNLGLRYYSAWTHSGSHSLIPTLGADLDRQISASVVAGLLASASRQRGLAFGHELDLIRLAVVNG